MFRPTWALVVASAVALTGCAVPGPSPVPIPAPAPLASWSTLSLDPSALPRHPPQSLRATLDAEAHLPAIAVGSVVRDGAARPVIWHPTPRGLGEPELLDVGGQPGTAYQTASDGQRSLVAGITWTGPVSTPFVLVSDDRLTWRQLTFPPPAVDQGMGIGVLALAPHPLVASVDDGAIRVVDLDTGAIADLPPPSQGRPSSVAAMSSLGTTAVLLVYALGSNGTSALVGYRSTDGGATWEQAESPSGVRPAVHGLVRVPGGLLAVGGTQIDNVDTATSWFTPDGLTWRQESLDVIYQRTSDGVVTNLDHRASSAAVRGDTAYVSVQLDNTLFSVILSRTGDGSWREHTRNAPWLAPGVSTRLIGLEDGLLTVRSWQHATEFGYVPPGGPPQAVAAWPWDTPESGSLGLAAVIQDVPYLFATRTVVTLDDRWIRHRVLTAYRVDGDRVVPADWTPPDASQATTLQIASNHLGDTVILGSVLTATPDLPNGLEIVGWRVSQGDTQPATGLAGPRTEDLAAVGFTGQGWVAVGTDRADLSADQGTAAAWVSPDGLAWQRSTLPSDPGRAANTQAVDVCALPDGVPFVVGWADDRDTGGRPVAWLGGASWTQADLTGLGEGVTSLSSCANTAQTMILQGVQGGLDQAWVTTDGVRFTPVSLTERADQALAVQAYDGGYAALGTLYADHHRQAVVWLSRDGLAWRRLPLPVTPPSVGALLLVWGDKLLAVYTTDAGQGAVVLNNPAELLAG
jgi:hypothetical protein